jgi:hypothetical protein
MKAKQIEKTKSERSIGQGFKDNPNVTGLTALDTGLLNFKKRGREFVFKGLHEGMGSGGIDISAYTDYTVSYADRHGEKKIL